MNREEFSKLFDLTGRVAIVTGGTRRHRPLTGRRPRLCRVPRWSWRAARPTSCAETEAHLTAMGGEALGVATHMGDLDALQALVDTTVERFGGIDIMMNNAANALTQPLGEFTVEAWNKSYDVNLRGPVFLVQYALPYLKASEHAAVVNVISAGAFLASTQQSMYGGAKAALMAFTRAQARRVGAVRDPGQRARAGNHRHRHGAQQPARGAGAHGRGEPDEAGRARRRDDRPGHVPRVRRRQLHDRTGRARRRRHGPSLVTRGNGASDGGKKRRTIMTVVDEAVRGVRGVRRTGRGAGSRARTAQPAADAGPTPSSTSPDRHPAVRARRDRGVRRRVLRPRGRRRLLRRRGQYDERSGGDDHDGRALRRLLQGHDRA